MYCFTVVLTVSQSELFILIQRFLTTIYVKPNKSNYVINGPQGKLREHCHAHTEG